MIVTVSEHQTLTEVSKFAIPGIIGYVGGIFTRWPLDKLAERRALLKGMHDRYTTAAQTDKAGQEDEFWRLGMLQNVGAAGLSARELCRLCDRIISHGLRDPRDRMISTVFKDHRRSLRGLLRWASRESVDLTDSSGFLRRHAEELDASQSHQI
jgi:hypothetical protein